MSEQVRAAGEATGDHVWAWPLHESYRRYIDSTFADMKNSSDLRQASPMYAANFLADCNVKLLPDLGAQNASKMCSVLAHQSSSVSGYFVGHPAAACHG